MYVRARMEAVCPETDWSLVLIVFSEAICHQTARSCRVPCLATSRGACARLRAQCQPAPLPSHTPRLLCAGVILGRAARRKRVLRSHAIAHGLRLSNEPTNDVLDYCPYRL